MDGVSLTPALAAPPLIQQIQSQTSPTDVTVDTHVVGDPSAGIQEVWVTWTGFDNHVVLARPDAGSGRLHALERHDADPGRPHASEMRFMLQAVNGVGLVGVDDNFGAYHSVVAAGTHVRRRSPSRRSATKTITDPDFGISPTSTSEPPRRLSASGAMHGEPGHVAGDRAHHGLGNCDHGVATGNATHGRGPGDPHVHDLKANQTITFAALGGQDVR